MRFNTQYVSFDKPIKKQIEYEKSWERYIVNSLSKQDLDNLAIKYNLSIDLVIANLINAYSNNLFVFDGKNEKYNDFISLVYTLRQRAD